MKKIFTNFFITRDWKMIFLKSSAYLFWFYILIALAIFIFQPFREIFLDWILRHNLEYFNEYLNWLIANGHVNPVESKREEIQVLECILNIV